MEIASGARVLVVEDEEIIRESLVGILEREGYQVTAVGTGREAIELLQDKGFEVALVDLVLEDVDGLVVLEEARVKSPDMVLIMLTGHASMDSAITALRLGAYDYLLKPCNSEDLKSTLRRGLERQRLQQEVRETRDYLERVMESLPLGLLTFDGDLRLVRANRVAQVMFGLGPEAVGRTAEELFPYPQEQKGWVLQSLQEMLSQRWERQLEELQMERPLPGRLHNLKLVPLPPGGLVLVEDVTEKVALEQQLIQAEKMAAKGEMAAQIAHELNNYLCIVSTSAELLKRYLEQGHLEEAGHKVAIILESILKIKRFTRGLVDFSRLEVYKVETDLNQIVEKTIGLVEGQNDYDHVEFTTKLDPNLPHIQADPDQIHQLLLNLFSNAAQAMNQGQITVITRRAEEDSVELEVADTGPGISPETLERIFKPHFSTKPEGHGFGLAICERIVKGHYGTIEVQSQMGQGTSFCIRLPI